MRQAFELWIGNRYVRSRSSNNFVSMISAISMLGIAIAVAVLIVVLSVVNGFERELHDRLLTMTAHASIEGIDGEIQDWRAMSATAVSNPRVRATAPFVTGQALLMFGEALGGAELRGIEPDAENGVADIDSVVTEGRLDSLAPGEFNIVLGVELARALRVAVGDKLTVTLAQGIVTPAGVVPRTKRFTVSGLYRVGMFEYDRRLADPDGSHHRPRRHRLAYRCHHAALQPGDLDDISARQGKSHDHYYSRHDRGGHGDHCHRYGTMNILDRQSPRA
jgi:lipoprotein-releasing system permease protein